MRVTCYVTVSYSGSVNVRKSRPQGNQIKPGDIVLPLIITIPGEAFSRYTAAVNIDVPATPQFQAAVELVEEPKEQP